MQVHKFYEISSSTSNTIIGDMLQIWTNDVIKSTNHRVVSPPNAPTTEDGSYSARYSIAVRISNPKNKT